jgi:DNA (cytosine-5)-methyltransferase 1
MNRTASSTLHAVSLFSNCGAGDTGFASAGFAFEVMAEIDPRRLSVALLNHPAAEGVPGDLRRTLSDVVNAYRRRAGDAAPALLAACPPCQGISSAQSARGLSHDADAGSRDHRNLLVQVIVDAVRKLRPRAVVVENVQAFLTRKVRHPQTDDPVSAARLLIAEMPDYTVYPLLADLADFSVPQSRKRCFLTFLRHSEPAIDILKRRHFAPYPWPPCAPRDGERTHVLLRDALASFRLPPLDAGTPDGARSDIEMHVVPVWPAQRYAMVSAIPPGSGRSAWENDQCLRCGRRARKRTRVRCSACGAILPRPITNDAGILKLVRGFHTSYRRMSPDLPAATVTTASGHVGSDRTVHPWENRVLSPLECALLQTFPSSFKWGDALQRWGHTHVRAMIGEAVPPLFTLQHGRVLRSLLRGVGPRVALDAQDARVTTAWKALMRDETHASHGDGALAVAGR